MLQTHEIVRIRPDKLKQVLHQRSSQMGACADTDDFSDHWSWPGAQS